jgi:hypothetical protein
MIQQLVHYSLHFGLPFVIALVFFRKEWKFICLLLLATMLVDLDHLLASPIFQSNRCSIGFHYLHTGYAILFYGILLFFRKPWNIIGLGLLLHMLTDFIDCLFIYEKCKACLNDAPALEWIESFSAIF